MHESGVGRLLVAGLHQAIAEELPLRLEFYEGWLSPTGLRDGRIGLASLSAVLSFLRQEDGDPFTRVTARAGALCADWLVDGWGGRRLALAMWCPRRLRLRVALGLMRRLAQQTYGGSQVLTRGTGYGRGHVDVRGSVFCHVRAQREHPQCAFYAAAFTRLSVRLGLPLGVHTAECRAAGGHRCRLLCRNASEADAS